MSEPRFHRANPPAHVSGIAPVAGTERPSWSVMIPTFEPRPEHLEETLRSVLRQDPGPEEMQIEIVDDASPGFDPRALAQSVAGTRISVFRHERPRGIGANWNACIDRARGHWIHILHQDDLVLDGFYRVLGGRLESEPGIGAAFTQFHFIDDAGAYRRPNHLDRTRSGILEDWQEHVFVDLKIQTVAIVVRRSVYETLGGFDTSLEYVVDWDMWKRIAVSYPIWFEAADLAASREHAASATRRLVRSGRNMAEIRKSIERTDTLLPPETAPGVARRARRTYTRFGVDNGLKELARGGDLAVAWRQFREASRCTSWVGVAGCALAAFLRKVKSRR